MTDPVVTPPVVQTPPVTPPAVVTPPVTPPAVAIVERPEYVPETYWDGETKAIKPEFGTHYTELSTFHKTETEKAAALAARKPEDIKFEIKLPDTVKVPDGMDLKINDNDPRVPILRELAVKRGLDQDTVNDLVALDAQMQITAHAADIARVAAADAKLGANANDRKAAVGNWLKGMKDRGELDAGEYEAVRIYATDAETVTALEKIMAKAAGTVPGHQPQNPATPPTQDHATRIWGENAFQSNPQAKAS